jgi:heme exporter protein A
VGDELNRHIVARTADADAPALEVRGLTRSFGTRWVLRGIDFDLDRGAIAAVTGRNGSGKTTMLRILATLLRPTRGTVTAFGSDIGRMPDALRTRLGYLAHNPGIYDDLTAAENLAFAQRMYGQAADAVARAVILDRVGLADAAHERVRGFSAGMRRRLALGRILLHPPTFLLLDEPYASFDADGIALVNDIARDTASRGGVVLVATHDMDRASAVANVHLDIRDGLLTRVPLSAQRAELSLA